MDGEPSGFRRAPKPARTRTTLNDAEQHVQMCIVGRSAHRPKTLDKMCTVGRSARAHRPQTVVGCARNLYFDSCGLVDTRICPGRLDTRACGFSMRGGRFTPPWRMFSCLKPGPRAGIVDCRVCITGVTGEEGFRRPALVYRPRFRRTFQFRCSGFRVHRRYYPGANFIRDNLNKLRKYAGIHAKTSGKDATDLLGWFAVDEFFTTVAERKFSHKAEAAGDESGTCPPRSPGRTYFWTRKSTRISCG